MNPPTDSQREEPRRRPQGERPAMFQTWSELLFLHWKVDPDELQKTLPPGLYVDTKDGAAWLGVVPFQMRRIRPAGLFPVPWLSYFLELNVRTYVHDESGRPGVWFYSLDTNRWAAYKIARTLFKLPYFKAIMETAHSGDGWIGYSCQRKGSHGEARFRHRPEAGASAIEAEPGSLEFFLLERYLLFSHDPRSGGIYSGQVHHRPYQYHPVEVSEYSSAPIGWDGLPGGSGSPAHACFAEPVDVEVFALKALDKFSG